jgi:hypothetical protein
MLTIRAAMAIHRPGSQGERSDQHGQSSDDNDDQKATCAGHLVRPGPFMLSRRKTCAPRTPYELGPALPHARTFVGVT